MTDPVQLWRRRLALICLAGAPALALSLAWAFARAPLPTTVAAEIGVPSEESQEHREREHAPELDAAAFIVKLWNPPPRKEEPPAPPPEAAVDRAPPLTLQLIGIIEEEGRLRAAVYDPQGDTLYIVERGEMLQQHTVTAIASTYVEFQPAGAGARAARRLELAHEGPPSPATGGRRGS